MRSHTADVLLSAWAQTLPDCLAEAVQAMMESFVDFGGAKPDRTVSFECAPGPPSELLVELLEEAIFVLDTQDVLVARVDFAPSAGPLAGEFAVLPADRAELIGAVPKAVSRHELSCARTDGLWRCSVIVDV